MPNTLHKTRKRNINEAVNWGLVADPYQHQEWSPEAELCIHVITRAFEDLQHRTPTDLDYRSAVRFFTDPTSNWAWMQRALQDADPTLVEQAARAIIQQRAAPVLD